MNFFAESRIMRIDESIDLLTRKIGEFFENILKASLVKKLLRKRSRTMNRTYTEGICWWNRFPERGNAGKRKAKKREHKRKLKIPLAIGGLV